MTTKTEYVDVAESPGRGLPATQRAAGAVVLTLLALTLLLSFKTPAASTSTLAPAAQVAAASASPGAAATAGVAAAKGSGTFTGAVVQDPYGQVQVQVTLVAGKITAVTALQLPSQGRSGFISQSVAPILQGEAISAQSGKIDTVSGATYTSEAYAQSLQSALDQAQA
jgi:uncharacterized protein with FMN-binding domain